MSETQHNEQIVGPDLEPNTDEGYGTICILLRDGRLFGPFASRSDARYWAIANDLRAFSTYDLFCPTEVQKANN